jgi:cytochrome P450
MTSARPGAGRGAQDVQRAAAIALQWDLFDSELRASGDHEHAVYACMRANQPVMYSPRVRQWALFDYDDVRAAFEDDDTFRSDFPTLLPPERRENGGFWENMTRTIPIHSDLPEHREYRKLLNPLFTPTQVAPLEGKLRDVAGQLLEPLVARGEFDLIADFGIPFPTMAFCLLMGLPLEDYDQLMRWKDELMHGAPADDVAHDEATRAGGLIRENSVRILDYLDDLFEQRRREPRDDFLTKLLEFRYAETRPLDHDELLAMGLVLFLGGLDTTSAVLSFTLHDFAESPEHRHAFIDLMDHPKRLDKAISELVRFHTVNYLARIVSRDIEIGGLHLRKGDLVNLMLPSANRDETRFECPHELRLDRHPNPHVGFGHGRHRCVGMHLARLELGVALQEVHRRMPEYTIKPGWEARLGAGVVRLLPTLPIVAAA